jgi:hypothetical protein
LSTPAAKPPHEKPALGLIAITLWALISAFYFWTAYSAHYTSLSHVRGFDISRSPQDYYPLLTEGFRHGHLYMWKEPPEALKSLSDPWDPKLAGDLRYPDVTYYDGHFYLYFGAAPVILLFWPVKFLTGYYISHSLAAPIFASLGLAFQIASVLAVIRHHFSRASVTSVVLSILVLGFASTIPQMLRRPDVWEVAIACAYFLASGAIYLAIQAYLARSIGKLSLAAVLMGLCVACRPTFLLLGLALLPIVTSFASLPHLSHAYLRRLGRPLVAVTMPVGLVLFIILFYNYQRFGSFLEFGQRYQMHARDERHVASLSTRFLPFNGKCYLLAPPRFTDRFPYVDGISLPTIPEGQLGFENVYGLLPSEPILLFGLALVLLQSIPRVRARLALPLLLPAFLILASALPGIFIFLFAGACNRYAVDFAPPLALLTAIALLTFDPYIQRVRLLRWTAFSLLSWSIVMSVLISIQHRDILKTGDEQTWKAMSRVGNLPAFLIDKLVGTQHGAMELEISFAARTEGTEHIISAGNKKSIDTLDVTYLPGNRLYFSCDHCGFGGPRSEIIGYEPGKYYRLTLELGSLYPDYDFQFYDRTSAASSDALAMRLYMALDGRILFNRRAAFDVHNINDIYYGWTVGLDARRSFSGVARNVHWIPYDRVPSPSLKPSPIHLRVRFPSGRLSQRDVLISTGAIGKADILYVEYVDKDHVSFGLDHWSIGSKQWPPVVCDLAAPHAIDIAMGNFLGGSTSESLVIRLDGREAVNALVPLYKVDQQSVYVGYAPYLNSSTGLEFSGSVLDFDQ